jgi:hypothetical protein
MTKKSQHLILILIIEVVGVCISDPNGSYSFEMLNPDPYSNTYGSDRMLEKDPNPKTFI